MRRGFFLVLFLAAAAHAQAPTERYAPAQLGIARDFLEQARAAALRGDAERAGKLAWQAGLDARLAWRMSDSEHIRAEASRIAASAGLLVGRLAGRH